MTTPYVGEIRIFSFPRIPTGWFACDGSLKSIAQYQTLYALIGTTYGGDGIQTFGVPDLRGQVPLHQGTGLGLTPRIIGEVGGTENVSLAQGNLPQHTHPVSATSNPASTPTPGPTVIPGALTGDTMYLDGLASTTAVTLSPSSVPATGGSTPHDNLMPTLTLSICMAWSGVFPTRN
jgi:microcystin-dependent protein